MPQQPSKTIYNPAIGDTVTFVESRPREHVIAQIELAPGGGNPMHRHRKFREQFEVLEGELTVTIEDKVSCLRPGERAEVPIGLAHRFANESAQPVRFMVTIQPPGDFEASLRIAYGLARDGRTTRTGVPRNPLHLAILFGMSDTYLAAVPWWLQRGLTAPLATIGRAVGAEQSLQRYLQ